MYITIENQLILNGDRHRANAIAYLEAGNLGYAIGSFCKMLRNYEKARLFQIDNPILKDITSILANQVAETIMNGKSNEIC